MPVWWVLPKQRFWQRPGSAFCWSGPWSGALQPTSGSCSDCSERSWLLRDTWNPECWPDRCSRSPSERWMDWDEGSPYIVSEIIIKLSPLKRNVTGEKWSSFFRKRNGFQTKAMPKPNEMCTFWLFSFKGFWIIKKLYLVCCRRICLKKFEQALRTTLWA